MTLYKQLVMSISMLFMLMFFGTLGVNIHTTRVFLQNQLASHAQDTATSLGLSLSQYSITDDLATMELMINAIFDRGYYDKIVLVSIEDTVLLEKSLSEMPETVPAWVASWVTFDVPEASAKVMSAWSQGGTVWVKSHTGYAYEEFWKTTVRLSQWFLLSAMGVLVLVSLGLRLLLLPLKRVQEQADAVANRDYQIQHSLPRTLELRSVVVAMNQMTEQVKSTFQEQAKSTERMREMAYQDNVTGLGNRRFFLNQLKSRVARIEPGENQVLCLIQLVDLKKINDTSGFEAGDQFVKEAAKRLLEALPPSALVARIAGADFALLTVIDDALSVASIAAALCQTLTQLHTQGLTPNPNVCYLGATMISHAATSGGLLAEADLALRVAQSKNAANQWHVHAEETQQTLTQGLGRMEWGQFVRDIIAAKHIQLYTQKVLKQDSKTLLHHEILVRLVDNTGKVWSAGAVIPMAEQFGLMGSLDQLKIQQMIAYLEQHPSHEVYAVNLYSAAMQDARFMQWLQTTLGQQRHIAQRLVFEFSEYGVVQQLDALKSFVQSLRELGCGFGLDHFGQAFTSFGYLNSLQPDYVKIDGGYIGDIVHNRDDQFFVESLCHVAHSLDILAIAEWVEEAAQAELLAQLGIDAIQGYWVHAPAELNARPELGG